MKATIKLNEMIKTADNFQYAINIAYDFSDAKKIENYIATNDAIRIIEDVLLSTKVNSSDRARLFIGAFGKGKSHLALILIALVYKKDIKAFKTLLEKIKEINPELHDYLTLYIKSQDRLLPVVVEGNKSSLQQSLLSALKTALEREGITDIMPNTFFSVAIETIDMWKKSYKATYKEFTELISTTPNEFIKKLNNYEQKVLVEFEKIYPQLTAGSSFSPILNGDVVSLYSDVIEEIQKHGFNGIFLVYDEFSKYLEGHVNSTDTSDIKVLQDLAEKANRSGSSQLHLLMITHKNIINYVDELPKVKVDAWKA
nr:restriction endonuclease subunit S [Vallitaleaceae bacterium]